MRIATIAAGLCLAAGAASAQDLPTAMFDIETAGDLAEICAPEATGGETDAATFCYGYIVGAGQLYAEVIRAESIRPIACPETVPTLEEIRANYLEWAGANPQFSGERAIDGLMRSAAATWPCP